MLEMSIDERQIRRLTKELNGAAEKVPQEISVAINATARKTKTGMSRQVRAELAVSARGVNRTITIPRKSSKATLSSAVRLEKTKRISLKEFKPRQTRRGVSYRISKTEGRKFIRSAFISHKLGGHVFMRNDLSNPRSKIHQKFGPSPWGVFVINNLNKPTVRETERELHKQIERRIKFRALKRQGVI